ncbi:rho GTPase-activating protein 15-like isoform X2 [Lycorma delicatula]|uniref:rho GTPase-activating protein 15-like isoform X2 n=1 Tax=Lycorma delicatula TaxID=130591 RepID=UPI003F51A08B
MQNKEGNDLSETSEERQKKVKSRLKNFFNRRPPMESLIKRGIWKDELAFGGSLEKVCGNEHPQVPIFVQHCIKCIEKTKENMKTDGLYLVSGNLSQVQKIRLQVDQSNLSILDQEKDIHVLTGVLKLFFRELKQPLIPFNLSNRALEASTNKNRNKKLSQFQRIVKNLPTPNHDTLKFLLQHLIRVTEYQEFNRMHISNLAIAFGPTLMWPEQESQLVNYMKYQSLVIEFFLGEFTNIFK